MAVARPNPYPNCHFLVDIGTGDPQAQQSRFSQVILPEAQIHSIAYRSGSDRTSEAQRLIGLTTYSRAILRRGVDGLMGLYEWWDQARNGNYDAVRNVVVVLADEARQPVLRWRLHGARPVAYRVGPLDSLANEPLIETIELEIESLGAE